MKTVRYQNLRLSLSVLKLSRLEELGLLQPIVVWSLCHYFFGTTLMHVLVG